jgi:hypothetical protein
MLHLSCLHSTANNFQLCISKERFSLASIQQNTSNYNVLSEIKIFCREVQYQMRPFSCQHWEQHIYKRNYGTKTVQDIQFSSIELQRWHPEFRISFLKYMVGIEVWLANSFCDHVTQISIRQMNF